jgi:hypothetical protein
MTALRPTTGNTVSVGDAVAFRVAAHGLDRRRSPRSLATVARTALPDYPKGAAQRSLAARCSDVVADTLDSALVAGTLVRAYSLRGSTHVFAGRDAAVYTAGVLPTPGDEQAARAALGSSWQVLQEVGVPAVEGLERVTDEIVDVVADGLPRPKGAISAALHGRLPDGWEPWCQRCGAHHTPDLLFRLASIAAGLRFAPDGTELVAGPRPNLADHAAARAELVRRFLAAYAPVPARAFAEWCGLGSDEAAASVEALEDEIMEVRVGHRPALALAADEKRLRRPPAVEGVRLVPAGDPFLNQRDRETLLPVQEHRRQLWRPAGAPGLVLIDGNPAGIWRHKLHKDRLVVTAQLWSTSRRGRSAPAIEEEAAILATAQAVAPDRLTVEIDSFD